MTTHALFWRTGELSRRQSVANLYARSGNNKSFRLTTSRIRARVAPERRVHHFNIFPATFNRARHSSSLAHCQGLWARVLSSFLFGTSSSFFFAYPSLVLALSFSLCFGTLSGLKKAARLTKDGQKRRGEMGKLIYYSGQIFLKINNKDSVNVFVIT